MKKLLLFLFLTTFFQAFSQEDAWVFLKDKPNQATFLENPLTMLTERALERRAKLSIPLDFIDVPVDQTYYNQIKGEANITVLAKSKWLNAIHIQGEIVDINNLLSTYSFINYIEFANKSLNTNGKSTSKSKIITPNHYHKLEEVAVDFNYGEADNQIKMLKGDYLHNEGLTGINQVIAIIDAGFPNVNTLDAFQRIRDNNQILGGYDFVERSDDFYSGDSHGTNVLSTIGGYLEDQFVGTAPDASFYLFRTENAPIEVPLEESLWVEAAEMADSLGVDVINTSLGYTTFDNAAYNYTYNDMDGKTTFITRGAEIGVSRGMILVNAAGNEGNDDWKYMGAPADAASIFTVGAVNATGNIAAFSSFGPTSDGRIKPDVLAQGQNVYVINHISGTAVTSNGTSFSSPIMAGIVACFWQAFPDLTNLQIMQRIRESADKYNNPTAQEGYGIPNFENAYSILGVEDQNFLNVTTVYPNPVNNNFTIQTSLQSLENTQIQIFNVIGKKVFEKIGLRTKKVNVSQLHSGIYILKITNGNQQKTIKLIKK